jgi:adhesin/invasin
MTSSRPRGSTRPIFAALSAAALAGTSLLLLSCGDQTGPARPVPGHFSLAPRFESDVAGIVPLAQARFVLNRIPDAAVALDTVIGLATDQDTVDLTLVVPLLDPSERFTLRIALVTPEGDTAFRAGPVEVAPSTTGPGPQVDVTLIYTGIGADAALVECLYDSVPLFAGDATLLSAVARDSAGAPIPGTPVAWRSLDTAIARVPAAGTGSVMGVAPGTARIVAELLTGPADTAVVLVSLPPVNILADSGGGQTGTVGVELPTELVARVVATDGAGVPNQWVRFAIASGAGSLVPDSVLTDSAGRARTRWTLGPLAGTQLVQATTPRLPGLTATFSATSTAGTVGGITIVAGDGQSGLVGTILAIAPSVRVADAQDNPVAGVPVQFSVSGGAGSVTGGSQMTDANGVATVGGWTLGPAVGINTLTVTADTLTPVLFTATATGPGGAMSMVLNDGNGQTALAGTAPPVPPSVLVRDTANNALPGVAVSFAATLGGGSVGDPAPLTDANGIAAALWTLGTPGANELTASLAGLPDVVFQATGTVGPADTVVIVSGNAQSDTAGLPLAQPLVVEVRDSVGNPVPGITVNWNTFSGSISPPTSSTDGAGQAQASWTLGTNAVNQTATAAVAGLTPAVFTATAGFPDPTVLLALAGTDRVRLTDSATLNVSLSAPAPVGGTLVTLSVDNAAVLGLDTTEVLIPEGETTTPTRVYGLSSGSTIVRGNATGYAEGATPILVTVQVLSMPTTLNVPYGGSASLPLQISSPAPVGGVAVTVVSTSPATVGVQAPTVTIPEGQQTANAVLIGVAPGAATVTASTADFGAAQTAAATTANLNIIEASAAFAQTFTDTLTVRLESGGTPIAAPGPGIPVAVTPRDPACLAATSPVTIQTGLVSATVFASYGGSASTPCTTYLVAEALGISPDSLAVTVNPPPGITTYVWTMGAGLQRLEYAYLGVTNHGGVNVVIKTGTPGLVLLSTSDLAVGTDSIQIFVANGQNYFQYYVQALEGVADTGAATVQITYEATGFTSGSSPTTIRRPVFDLYPIPSATTTLSDSTPFYAYIGYTLPNYGYVVEQQPIRPGGQPAVVTVMNGDPAIGDLVGNSAARGDTLTVTIAVGQSNSPTTVAAGGIAFDPDNAGTTTITAGIPGYDELTYYNRTVAVSAPGITTYTWNMGAGLQRQEYGYLGATNHGGRNVVIKATTPGLALLSPDGASVGTDSIEVFVANGQNYFQYYVQALEGVTDTAVALITYEATGFITDTSATIIRRPVFDLYPIPSATTTLSDSTPFYAYIGYSLPGYTYVVEQQPIRTGGQPVTVTIAHDNPGVGEFITTARIGDTVTVQIPAGAANSPTTVEGGGVAFDPVTAGVTTVSGSIPGFDELTYYNRAVTVSAPGITLYEATVGAGLQKSVYGNLDASNHGGVSVVVKSSAPGVARLAPDATTPGTDSLVLFVPDGQSYFYYYAQGVEAQTGTPQVTARATGFTDGSAPLNIVTPTVGVYALPTTVSVAGDSVAFYAQVGVPYADNQYLAEVQTVRAGGTPLTVTFAHSEGSVADLITTLAGRADTVTVTIPIGSYYSPTVVGDGGAAFKGTAAGSTVVTGSVPGFLTLIIDGQRTVTVTP